MISILRTKFFETETWTLWKLERRIDPWRPPQISPNARDCELKKWKQKKRRPSISQYPISHLNSIPPISNSISPNNTCFQVALCLFLAAIPAKSRGFPHSNSIYCRWVRPSNSWIGLPFRFGAPAFPLLLSPHYDGKSSRLSRMYAVGVRLARPGWRMVTSVCSLCLRISRAIIFRDGTVSLRFERK